MSLYSCGVANCTKNAKLPNDKEIEGTGGGDKHYSLGKLEKFKSDDLFLYFV